MRQPLKWVLFFNMRQPQYKKAGFITDEEYKELTDILLLKLVKAHKLYKKKIILIKTF